MDEYKERLGILEAKTKYHSFSKSELKDRALVLVNDIRRFLEQVEEEDNDLRLQQDQEWTNTKSEEDKQKIRSKYTNASMRQSSQRRSEYDRCFKVEAILLRDELISRLPRNTQKLALDFFRYEHPTNPIGMGMIADNLERLAKSIAE